MGTIGHFEDASDSPVPHNESDIAARVIAFRHEFGRAATARKPGGLRLEAVMFKKILVPTDGSDHALAAADSAAEIAQRFGSETLLLSVYSPPALLAPDYGGYSLDRDAIEEIQTGITQRTSQPFITKGLRFDTIHETGNTAQIILDVAEAQQCDAIVLGSRGLGDLQRFLLGSISDRVAHHAHCAVLIVKAEHHS